MPSLRLVRSLARWLNDLAAKNAVGESRAELTLLPVERRVCVRFRLDWVVWRRRRLLRILADSWTCSAIEKCSLLETGSARTFVRTPPQTRGRPQLEAIALPTGISYRPDGQIWPFSTGFLAGSTRILNEYR